jgi:hypothetical protein
MYPRRGRAHVDEVVGAGEAGRGRRIWKAEYFGIASAMQEEAAPSPAFGTVDVVDREPAIA